MGACGSCLDVAGGVGAADRSEEVLEGDNRIGRLGLCDNGAVRKRGGVVGLL